MNNERKKKLLETVKEFNKKQKDQVITFGDKIESVGVIPSGIEVFDKAIGGGFKRSAHTLLSGAFSVGKTALVLTTIANAQKEGLNVCYVNVEKPIDRQRFEFFGINLDDMLYIEAPNNAEQALEALRTFSKEKVIDLFIFDSVQGLSPKSVQIDGKGESERALDKLNITPIPKMLSNFYNVVNGDIFRSKAAVIWINQLRTKGIGTFFTKDDITGGNAQLFYAYQHIKMRRDEKKNNPKDKREVEVETPDGELIKKKILVDIGFGIVCKLEKTNSSNSLKELSEFTIPYYYESGFKKAEEKPISVPYPSEKVQEKLEESYKELKENGYSDESIEKIEKGLDDAKQGKISKIENKRGRPKKVKEEKNDN